MPGGVKTDAGTVGSPVRRKFCIRSGILTGLKNYPAPEPVSPDFTAIVDLLMRVNATGLFEAFYEYYPHVRLLEISIYEGRWNYLKHPVFKMCLECGEVSLFDFDTDERITPEHLLERLILLIQ